MAGKHDWYLDDWIKGLKEFRDPVFIRLSHEMDGDWYPYSEGYKKDPTRNTARDYVAYWRYVVDRFRKAGVTNVAWVLQTAPPSTAISPCRPSSLYFAASACRMNSSSKPRLCRNGEVAGSQPRRRIIHQEKAIRREAGGDG